MIQSMVTAEEHEAVELVDRSILIEPSSPKLSPFLTRRGSASPFTKYVFYLFCPRPRICWKQQKRPFFRLLPKWSPQIERANNVVLGRFVMMILMITRPHNRSSEKIRRSTKSLSKDDLEPLAKSLDWASTYYTREDDAYSYVMYIREVVMQWESKNIFVQIGW